IRAACAAAIFIAACCRLRRIELSTIGLQNNSYDEVNQIPAATSQVPAEVPPPGSAAVVFAVPVARLRGAVFCGLFTATGLLAFAALRAFLAVFLRGVFGALLATDFAGAPVRPSRSLTACMPT